MISVKEVLDIDEPLSEFYYTYVNVGKKHLKNKKIVFSIVTRNSSDIIEKNVNSLIEAVKYHVSDYRVVIFENDSTDSTKKILACLSESNPKIIHNSVTFGRPILTANKNEDRTNFLAEYRNFNLAYIKANFSDFDYTVVVDTGFLDFNIEGFYNTMGIFSHSPDLPISVAGNSYRLTEINGTGELMLWNHDSWPYRHSWWYDMDHVKIKSSPKNLSINNMYWFGLWIMPIGMTPFEVNSAFGGMAIYRTADYIQGTYVGGDSEHVLFHLSLSKRIKNWQLWLNPSQVMLLEPR